MRKSTSISSRSFLCLSFSLRASTHIFNGLQFTNQIAMGGDNADTVYFNLESRDLVGRVDGDRKRRVGILGGCTGSAVSETRGKAGDVDSD